MGYARSSQWLFGLSIVAACGCNEIIGLTEPRRDPCPREHEICDGIDNDCDGIIDNVTWENPNCNTTGAIGVCGQGTKTCLNGIETCSQPSPAVELCDGVDNNCDGLVDEGNPEGGASCATGKLGICATGILTCSNSALSCTQITMAAPDLCDNLDNDCDGQVDNNIPGTGQPCMTGLPGVCAAGTSACENGIGTCKPIVAGGAEVCDGFDNDCNGIVDDGNPGGGAACTTGLAGICSAGTMTCTSGALGCVSDQVASVESCDGMDNDCDGVVDNGDPGGGANCTTGKLGACAMGTTRCSAGSIVCDQIFQPTAELCDGLDNNCDGMADESNPGVGMTCATGLTGVCANGTVTACTAGQPTCQQNMQASVELCTTSSDENCDGQSGCVGLHVASKGYGGASDQIGMAIAVDSAENVYIAGHFQGTLNWGATSLTSAGGYDIFLAKLDKNLNLMWAKRFGDASNQYVSTMALDSLGNSVIVGRFAGTVTFGGTLTSAGSDDIYVAKFSGAGTHVWSLQAGDASYQAANGVALDNAANVIVVGDNQGIMDFGCGPTAQPMGFDMFIAKLNSGTGACVWSTNISTTNHQSANDVAVDANGNCYVTGDHSGSFTIGNTTLQPSGATDIFISKFNSMGTHSWTRGFGGSGYDYGEAMAINSTGEIILAGTFEGTIALGSDMRSSNGSSDIFLSKLTANGDHVWSRAFGSSYIDYLNDIVLDPADNIILTGASGNPAIDFGLGTKTCGGNNDVIGAKVDQNGTVVWGNCWGVSGWDIGHGVTTNSLGNVLLTGEFVASIDFGGGPISSNGKDIFVAKLTP